MNVLKLLALHRDLDDRSLSVLATVVPGLSALVGKDIGLPEVLETQDARLRWLRVLAEVLQHTDVPMLILLEDLHWIDAESLALLQQIVPTLRSLPILVVGTYREEELLSLTAALVGAQTLHIPRLCRSEMEQLCLSMLGSVGQDPKLLSLIERETEGIDVVTCGS